MAKVQRTLKKALLVKELRPVEENVLSRDCEVFATLQFLCPKSLSQILLSAKGAVKVSPCYQLRPSCLTESVGP